MAGNASILIQEQNSGKRTNFLVFELDGCGQKTGKSRLVSCPVVVRKKDDFVYIIPFDDNMKVISEQYQFINYHHKADQENSRRGLVRGLRMYNCFKSIYGIEGDVLTTDMVDMLVAFLFGYSYSPSGENDLTTRDPATINAYLASIRQYLKYIGKPCNHLDAQELVSVVSEYDGLTTTVQRKQYKIRAKEDPHKHDYAPEHVLPDEYRRLRDIAAARGDNQALVLFALMYIYCMRLGECLSLTQEDITFIRQGDKMIPVLILRKRKGSERWSSPKNIRECERKDYGSKKQAKRIIPITMDFYTSLARFLDKEIDDHKTKFPKKRHLLEADIEAYLLEEGGYVKGNQDTYDKAKAIDMPVLISFIEKTQPKMWQRYQNVYGDKAQKQLYSVFQENVDANGLIHVLRYGVKDRGMQLKFAYFAPASAYNEELVEKYKANILTETRQFHFSDLTPKKSIDIVLSLNGIPVVSLELKNQLTGQSIQNSQHQYMYDRDPKEFLFHFNNRILVYFGVDLYNVIMTTELKGKDTFFLPFDQGSNGAGNVGDGGNPENPDGYATSYLWEHVLQRDTLLSILQRYISKEVKETVSLQNGKQVKKKTTRLIFPRYHQLDVVEKLIADTKATKEGKNYLIQHSAGSGKSNSIAWLTYRLAALHDLEDKEMFQTVFVVTDRRVLNRQLQETILGFEHLEGQIVTITDKDNSSVLKDAINDKRRIIITTLHRFPLIYKELDNHRGKKFAVIVDEAHSSQSGKSAEKLKAALADTDESLREMAELEGKTEEQIKDEMDALTEILLTQGQHKNQYFYAFTATPKPKTLQTFGVECGVGEDGLPEYDAFHHYSMRQAIDEGFILDVLKYYTTVETSYEVAKTVEENPEYEEPPATKAIKAYHDNHQYVIEKAVEIIVEKFREITLKKIDGKAKAMVVSASRAHAVRYYLAMKEYCKQKGYDDVRPLVAFSGTVSYQGKDYTEPQLNSTEEYKISEAALPLYFGSDMFNILIVAEKYQTGFDEPLLHTMFVLKGLKGVKAVQTLSRLNRSCKGKIDTYVLDFSNTAESIKASFKPFYEDTLLGAPVDVNVVYKYLNEILSYHLWSQEQVDAVFEIYKKEQDNTSMGKLSSILKPIIEDFQKLDEEDQFKIRFLVRAFIRFYAYMAQIVRTFDKDLLKTYIFCEFLFKLLPKNAHEKVDLDNKLSLEHHIFDVQPTGSIELKPTKEDKTLKGEKGGTGNKVEEKRDLLDNIIDKINIMYAGNFTEADRVIIETIYDKFKAKSKSLQKQAKNSDVNMFANNIFPEFFSKIAQQCYVEQMDAFAKLFEDPSFYKRVMEEMGKAMYFNFKNGQ